jgi:hypothetical protein
MTKRLASEPFCLPLVYHELESYVPGERIEPLRSLGKPSLNRCE